MALPSSNPSARTFTGWFGLLFLVTQLPLYLVRYPDIQDYVNHAARLHIALQLSTDPFVARYYQWTPGIFPNLPLDTIGLGLAAVFGPELGIKLFSSLASLLVGTGCLALARAWTGRVSPFLIGILLFNQGLVLHYGLFNFLFGIGVALWLTAAWITAATNSAASPAATPTAIPAARRCIYFALGATGLYLCHLMAFGVYLIAIALAELGSGQGTGPTWRRLLPVALQALPALLLHLLVNQPGRPVVEPLVWNGAEWLTLLVSKLLLAGGLLAINLSPDALWGGMVNLTLIVAGFILWKRHGLTLLPPARLLVLALAACVLLLPRRGFGSALLDSRLTFPLILVAWSGLDWRPMAASAWRRACLVTLGVLIVATSAHQAWAWQRMEPLQEQLRTALQLLPRGAKVAVVSLPHTDGTPPAMSEHAAAWSVIDRSAFLSALWGRPYQPFLIGIRPEFQAEANLARLDQPGKPPPPIGSLIGHYDVVVAFGSPQEAMDYGREARSIFQNADATVFDLGSGPVELLRVP
ncbi:MAG TPA: hypothetical protein VJ548_09610 [Azospira sp.]|nr:hypothetical protein [Azospira sp.]